MEDRKRPAVSSADDLAPPSKRLAINGSKVKDEATELKEEGWVEVSTHTLFHYAPPEALVAVAVDGNRNIHPSSYVTAFDSPPATSTRRCWMIRLTKPVMLVALGDSNHRRDQSVQHPMSAFASTSTIANSEYLQERLGFSC